jgi:hypothetical protein
MKGSFVMKAFFGTLFGLAIVSLIIWAIVRIVANVSFGMDCTDYLKRAADANSIPLASQNLNVAINYLESHDLTSGTVSIFLKQPKNDVGFLYQNLIASRNDLASIKEDATPLEKSNVLMKLRETLLDSGKDGDNVTLPNGISIYPNNLSYFWWSLVSLIMAVVFGIGLLATWDEY